MKHVGVEWHVECLTAEPPMVMEHVEVGWHSTCLTAEPPMEHVGVGSLTVVQTMTVAVGQVVVEMPNKHDVVVAWSDVVQSMMGGQGWPSRNCGDI